MRSVGTVIQPCLSDGSMRDGPAKTSWHRSHWAGLAGGAATPCRRFLRSVLSTTLRLSLPALDAIPGLVGGSTLPALRPAPDRPVRPDRRRAGDRRPRHGRRTGAQRAVRRGIGGAGAGLDGGPPPAARLGSRLHAHRTARRSAGWHRWPARAWTVTAIAGLPLVRLDHPSLRGVPRVVKGTADRLGALLALVLIAPILLGCAIAVRRDGGPRPAPADSHGSRGAGVHVADVPDHGRQQGTRRASGVSCTATASTNSPSSSTCSAGRWPWSALGRPFRSSRATRSRRRAVACW